MEANEVQELHEQHAHAAAEGGGHSGNLKPVSFSMAVLAVLVAIVTVLGHREHTEAVLNQARASDQWALYQAKKIRQNDTQLGIDLFGSLALRDQAGAQATANNYKAHLTKWAKDLDQSQEVARGFEERVEAAERKASRFDLGEALLEIGLVVTSITLLTRQKMYWSLGLTFGGLGLLVAVEGLFLH